MATSVAASSLANRFKFSYTVPIACGTISGECCECTPLVAGRYGTAITLLNPSRDAVDITVYVAPTTLAGATAGRWAEFVPYRSVAGSTLEGESATTIDCCAISKLTLGAVAPTAVSATYGVVRMETTAMLEVSATYTSVGGEGTSPSIDVEFIEARALPVPEKARNPERPSKQPPTSSPPGGRKGARSN